MSEKRAPIQIPLPGGSGSAPDGAVQFRDDWPGLFLRGDTAIAMATSIRQLEATLAGMNTDAGIALSRVSRIADLIERDVRV